MDKLIEEMLPHKWQRDIVELITANPDKEIMMIVPYKHGKTQMIRWYEKYQSSKKPRNTNKK